MIFKETLIKSLSFAIRVSRFPHMCRALLRFPPALFHTAGALSAPSGHLPLEGKAVDARETYHRKPSGIAPYIFAAKPPPSFLIPNSSFLIPNS